MFWAGTFNPVEEFGSSDDCHVGHLLRVGREEGSQVEPLPLVPDEK